MRPCRPHAAASPLSKLESSKQLHFCLLSRSLTLSEDVASTDPATADFMSLSKVLNAKRSGFIGPQLPLSFITPSDRLTIYRIAWSFLPESAHDRRVILSHYFLKNSAIIQLKTSSRRGICFLAIFPQARFSRRYCPAVWSGLQQLRLPSDKTFMALNPWLHLSMRGRALEKENLSQIPSTGAWYSSVYLLWKVSWSLLLDPTSRPVATLVRFSAAGPIALLHRGSLSFRVLISILDTRLLLIISLSQITSASFLWFTPRSPKGISFWALWRWRLCQVCTVVHISQNTNQRYRINGSRNHQRMAFASVLITSNIFSARHCGNFENLLPTFPYRCGHRLKLVLSLQPGSTQHFASI